MQVNLGTFSKFNANFCKFLSCGEAQVLQRGFANLDQAKMSSVQKDTLLKWYQILAMRAHSSPDPEEPDVGVSIQVLQDVCQAFTTGPLVRLGGDLGKQQSSLRISRATWPREKTEAMHEFRPSNH